MGYKKEIIPRVDTDFPRTYAGMFATIALSAMALRAVFDIWLAFNNIVYGMLFYNMFVVAVTYLSVPLGLIYMLYKNSIEANNWRILLVAILQWLVIVIASPTRYDGEWISMLLVCISFAFLTARDKVRIFDIFYWIIQVQNIVALAIYVCYLCGFDIGFTRTIFERDNVYAEWTYYIRWGIFAILQQGPQLRLCGIFEEPGGLATACALLLVARFRYNPKWENWLLLATTLCSLSVAGTVILVLYFSIWLIRKDVRYLFLLAGLLSLFTLVSQVDWGNESVNNFVARFAYSEERGFQGNNRADVFMEGDWNRFLHSYDVWFGLGRSNMLPGFSLSWKCLIFYYGIVGTAIVILSWILAAWKRIFANRDSMVLFLIFMLSLLQRPITIESLYGYILLFGGFEWIKAQHNKRYNRI